MQFPGFLSENGVIGVTAPSCGLVDAPHVYGFESAKSMWQKKNISVKETPNVRKSIGYVSSSKEDRAKEYMSLIEDSEVEAIVCAAGGDFLMEMLPLLDFETIKKNPKWTAGYSDPTGIVFLQTVLGDIASIYGGNFTSYGMDPLPDSIKVQRNFLLGLLGNKFIQKSYPMFQDHWKPQIIGIEPYEPDTEVCWKTASQHAETFSGRAIGGCFDVLMEIVGTKMDKVNEFAKKYAEDGILWYLESFSLPNERIYSGLWQLREAGWFENAKGFMFGRPAMETTSLIGMDYYEAIKMALGDLNVPIVFDACVGHKPPCIMMINGAMTKVSCANGKGSVEIELK
ncbi:MAG: LD-carboxypeptidase [Lachnospiraceae bacterium]|nr:LD-carboxypeptidase [Lachnospiraceae bacterium]